MSYVVDLDQFIVSGRFRPLVAVVYNEMLKQSRLCCLDVRVIVLAS
jgi:hypothetical protein